MSHEFSSDNFINIITAKESSEEKQRITVDSEKDYIL